MASIKDAIADLLTVRFREMDGVEMRYVRMPAAEPREGDPVEMKEALSSLRSAASSLAARLTKDTN